MPVGEIPWPTFGLFVHQRTCASCLKPLKPRGVAIALKKPHDRPFHQAYTPLVATGVVAARAAIPGSIKALASCRLKNSLGGER
mgnify:CR=1 FL=1